MESTSVRTIHEQMWSGTTDVHTIKHLHVQAPREETGRAEKLNVSDAEPAVTETALDYY